MAANGGDIVVQLRMEDGQFRVAIVQAGDLVNALKGRMDSTAASVKTLENHTQSLGRRFRDLVLTLGNLRFVAMDINDIFLKLPLSILKTAGELEKMQQLMTGLSKETDTAAKKLEGINNINFVIGMAKTAPFEIRSLADSFVKLKTAGLDPTQGSMQALVDSVARFGGTGETLKRASVAIQQMAGKGVISMEELRQQLGEAVPTAMKNMADGIGVSMEKLAKVVSSGTLKAGPALEKMFLRMQIENEGAAQEMMSTWVGMLARLQTEWDLTAQHIAKSGLGQEAKNAISELTTAIQSPAMQEFGASFGKGLGEVVKDTVSIIRTLIEFKSEIVLLGQAWLGYKLITSVIAPAGMAIQKSFKENTAAMQASTRALAVDTANAQSISVAKAQIQAGEAVAREADLVRKLASDVKELESVKFRNATILASDTQLHAQLKALRAVEAATGALNQGQQQSILRNLDVLSTKNGELLTRQRELQGSIPMTTQALAGASAAAQSKATEVAKLTTGMAAARAATMAATVASNAYGAASAFLGGPVGIAIAVIGGLLYMWNSITNAANEAAAAQLRAVESKSIAGDEKFLQKEADAAAQRLKNAKEQVAIDERQQARRAAGNEERNKVQRTPAQIEANSQALKKAIDDELAARTNLERGKRTIQDIGASQLAANETAIFDQKMRDFESQATVENNLIKKQKEEYVKLNGDASKKAVADLKVMSDKESVNFLKSLKERQKMALDGVREAEKLGGASEKGSAVRVQQDAVAKALQKRADELQQLITGTAKRIDVKVEMAGDKPDKDTPIQRLIETLKADKAQLDAQLEGLDKTTGKGNKVAGEVEKMRQRFVNGDYNDKKTGAAPTQSQRELALKMAEDNASAKKNLEDIEKAAKDVLRVTDFVNGMKADVKAAMDLLADPLETAKRGPMQERLEKFLGKNETELAEYAKAVKGSAETVKTGLTNVAREADAANIFGKMAQDTKQINDSLVSDQRLAVKARMDAETERHRQAMQNVINELTVNGTAAETIKTLQDGLNQNLISRAKDTAAKTQSPMEKMAENWSNATKNMEDASVGWANKSMDAMTEMAMTGKADFSSLARSIIADLIKIQLQKAMSGVVSGAASAFTAGAAALFGGGGGFANDAGGMELAGSLGFANGGIMSSGGSLALKQYAAGGIANSPQVAVFGEGSMNEAYVPLPDGRSIPVTMKGGGGASDVQINITVNQATGSEESNSEGDVSGMYRKMGERIKAVVREEMTSQSRPGGMLYR